MRGEFGEIIKVATFIVQKKQQRLRLMLLITQQLL